MPIEMEAPYDFDAFLTRMVPLAYREMMAEAEEEVVRAERGTSGVRGAPAKRAAGATQYAARIKAFLWFMREHTKPGSASAEEFARYRRVVKALVDRGEFRPEALKVFE